MAITLFEIAAATMPGVAPTPSGNVLTSEVMSTSVLGQDGWRISDTANIVALFDITGITIGDLTEGLFYEITAPALSGASLVYRAGAATARGSDHATILFTFLADDSDVTEDQAGALLGALADTSTLTFTQVTITEGAPADTTLTDTGFAGGFAQAMYNGSNLLTNSEERNLTVSYGENVQTTYILRPGVPLPADATITNANPHAINLLINS